jgi:transposase-like protein
MQQKRMSLLEFQDRFSAEESCEEYLFKLRWPEGFRCPRCGHDRYSLVTTRHVYQCSACHYHASLTAGTVFHKTRTPLRKWFWMIFLMARQKTGVSMLGMQRLLEIRSYKTVWSMGHKIRKAMADRDAAYELAGLIEMDDGFIGPKKKGKTGRGSQGKSKILVSVESRGVAAGFGCMHQVPGVNREEILCVAQEKVRPGAQIRTDGWQAYRVLGTNSFDHEEVVLRGNKEGLSQLQWAHRMIANLKGNLRGVHHGVSGKHLQRYLSEFCYRFNRRFWESQLFDRTLSACARTSTITYAELRT